MTIQQQPCYLFIPIDLMGEPFTTQELKKTLEKGDEEAKIDCMKKILIMMVNGDHCSELLMWIIRFILPEKNKTLKKLLLLYFELCEKVGPDGKLKQEMILVCNALRNDLQHPNEYLRGSTLKFLMKLKEPELLEPLIPSIRNNLDHRHAYVRRNAIMATAIIYKDFNYLVPDGPKLLSDLLYKETDSLCKRTAIYSLSQIDLNASLDYFKQVSNKLESFDPSVQQALVDLMKICANSFPEEKSLLLQSGMNLISSTNVSNMMKLECTTLLLSLSSNALIVRACGTTYMDLITSESDNNVRLFLLNKLSDLFSSHTQILQNNLVDLLNILSSSSDLEIIKKALSIVIENISASNALSIVEHLKKHLEKTVDDASDNAMEYKNLLMSALTKCAASSENLASLVISTLISFLTEKSSPYLMECVRFIKMIIQKYPNLRSPVTESICDIINSVRSSRILRSLLWIISEATNDYESTFDKFEKYVDEIIDIEEKAQNVDTNGGDKGGADAGTLMFLPPSSSVTTKVLADGTYASESAFTLATSNSSTVGGHSTFNAKHNAMRQVFFENGNIYVPAALAISILRILSRAKESYAHAHHHEQTETQLLNKLHARGLQLLLNMLKLFSTCTYKEKINSDSIERISLCLRILATAAKNPVLEEMFERDEGDEHLDILKKAASDFFSSAASSKLKKSAVDPDSLISFSLITVSDTDKMEDNDMTRELMKIKGVSFDGEELSSKLDQVCPLTAISDPIYAEAYIDFQDLVVLLDIIIVNQTSETLQNICLELISHNGNRCLFRPVQPSLGPYAFLNLKADFKILSADQTIIQGCLSFDPNPNLPMNFATLNSITLDALYFIEGGHCEDTDFASLWRVLEWENKIHIKTHDKSFQTVIKKLCRLTNFTCLTPFEEAEEFDQTCEVYSANLFARSKFNDEVLANVSLDKSDGKVCGHIRIRSRSNGLAFIIGNKISEHLDLQ